MRKYIPVIVAAAAVVFACRPGGGESHAVETAVADTTTTPAVFPEAERAETLLKAAGIPIATRNDLVRELPEGCVWHAVYAAEAPEIILETYAFADAETAMRYGVDRNNEMAAMDVLREFATVTNGALLLVAYYDPMADREAKQEALAKFVSAFAGGE